MSNKFKLLIGISLALLGGAAIEGTAEARRRYSPECFGCTDWERYQTKEDFDCGRRDCLVWVDGECWWDQENACFA